MKTSWDLSYFYKNEADPAIKRQKTEIQQATNQFVQKWSAREDYLKDPVILTEALEEYAHWAAHFSADGKIGYYFFLRSSLDQVDPEIKAKVNQITEFANQMRNQIQFFEMRISKIAPSHQTKFLQAKSLSPYKHFLEKLFAQSTFLLAEAEEKILNLKRATSYDNWVAMTATFISKEEGSVIDETGKKKNHNFSEILSLINSSHKQVRDSAATVFNQILKKHAAVATEELNAILAHKKTEDDLRKFPRPDSSRHLADDIDSYIVDVLIDSVSSRYDLAHRFYRLKAKIFGQKKLEYHERNVEYGSVNKKYSYIDSLTLVLEVFDKLDPEFVQITKNFSQEGRVDVYPAKGKRNGAFCMYNLITQPTYILLNHTDKLVDVLTLAHELGHGINDELMKKAQNSLNFGTPTSTAEVASTFMEDFVLQRVLEQSPAKLRLSLLVMKLNQDISTIFRQVACYRFEQELHQRFREIGYISTEEIGQIFQKHMAAYMGPAVKQSAGAENWWVYWNHIRYFFYVYSYAGGLLISKSLQAAVRKEPEYINKVKGFLSAGLSKSPREIFAELDIDIAHPKFWHQGLDEIEKLLAEAEKLAPIKSG